MRKLDPIYAISKITCHSSFMSYFCRSLFCDWLQHLQHSTAFTAFYSILSHLCQIMGFDHHRGNALVNGII
jgi:hypothetical protein